MHFTCTESYVVLSGKGLVQTLGVNGFEEVPLETGKLIWFTPGVIHRLINSDGKRELLVMMQNAGLPEAGDHVLCFPLVFLLTKKRISKKHRLRRPKGWFLPPVRRRLSAGAT